MRLIPFHPATSPLPPNPCYIHPNGNIDPKRNDWWAKTPSLTTSFFPSKHSFQQEPQLRGISQKDKTYSNAHFIFPNHKDDHRGKRCFAFKNETTFAASIVETTGFTFSWKSDIWGCKPQRANQWHMKYQALCRKSQGSGSGKPSRREACSSLK